ncbi:MAG: amino acid ABC transporter substrate-binding protein [Acidimicrobiales bacterium]|jgi:general L-amino acid transport system substrate-binding protein
MNKSKLLKLLAMFLTIGVVAAACGSDSDGDDAAPATTAAAPATTAAAPATTAEVEVVAAGSLLDTVQARGTLNCGVSGSAVAFSETQADGSVVGFDADYCRAVAAAVLGDANAVNFVALTASERFTAVQTGDVDVLIRNTTWTQSRDSDVGMDFGPTTYYDGQQLMARASDGFTGSSQVSDIDGAIVCTNAGTTTEKNIAEAAEMAGADITLLAFETSDEVWETFIAGGCDITTTDGSALVGRKVKNQPADQEWVIFPATPISKEPLGPTYGQNDSAWADAVNWTVYAMIIMDEYGITSATVDSHVGDAGEVGRLLGGDGELQTVMGLSADAFYQVIKQVGNYGEVYDSNLNPVGLYREGSSNAGWLDGGLIYSPPAR